MNEALSEGTQGDPADLILQTAVGHVISAALNAAVALGIADLLADAPRPVSELARETNTNEDALYRMLRLLASRGIFAEESQRSFIHTPASATLRKDAPDSTYGTARWICDPFHFRIYTQLLHSVRTGRPCADRVLGMPVFDYFAEDERESAIFNAAMVSNSARIITAVLEAYDFGDIGVLVDVAGGHGGILCPILQKYPQMRGILIDLQHVLDGADHVLLEYCVETRVQRKAADIFKRIPAAGDAYLLKHIIHDWDDRRSLIILRNIAAAMGTKPARLILLEAVLAPRNQPQLAKAIDIEMLALPGGRERTEEEFRGLLRSAGFELTRVVPTKSPLCIIEAVPQAVKH